LAVGAGRDGAEEGAAGRRLSGSTITSPCQLLAVQPQDGTPRSPPRLTHPPKKKNRTSARDTRLTLPCLTQEVFRSSGSTLPPAPTDENSHLPRPLPCAGSRSPSSNF